MLKAQDTLSDSRSNLSSNSFDDPVRFYIACALLAILIAFIALNLSGKWKAQDDTQHRLWRLVSSILMAIVGTQFLDGVIKLETNFEYISVYAVGGPAFGLVNFFFWGPFRVSPEPGVFLPLPKGTTFSSTINLINESSDIRIQLENFGENELLKKLPYPFDLSITNARASKDIRDIGIQFPGLTKYVVKKIGKNSFKLTKR